MLLGYVPSGYTCFFGIIMMKRGYEGKRSLIRKSRYHTCLSRLLDDLRFCHGNVFSWIKCYVLGRCLCWSMTRAPDSVRIVGSQVTESLEDYGLGSTLRDSSVCVRLVENTNFRFSEKDIPEWVDREIFDFCVDDDGGGEV